MARRTEKGKLVITLAYIKTRQIKVKNTYIFPTQSGFAVFAKNVRNCM